MRGASPREICLTSRSQASSSTRAGREQAPGERPGREGPACSKDDTATEARVRAAAESGGWRGGVLAWESPPGSLKWPSAHRGPPSQSHSFWEDISTHDLSSFSTMPAHCAFALKVLTAGGHPRPPALWPSPLPVSRALSVRSPRALMSRKGLFPMPMETICCTRSSREQRPCYQPLCSFPTLIPPSHSSGISCHSSC